jgi:hypothetical protein
MSLKSASTSDARSDAQRAEAQYLDAQRLETLPVIVSPFQRPGPSAPTSEQRWSLAARLTAWYALSSFALVFCATSLLYIALVRSVETDSDHFLSDRVQDLRLILAEHPPGTQNQDLNDQLEEDASTRRRTPIFFRVIDVSTGQVVGESPGARRFVPPDVFPPPPEELNHTSHSVHYALPAATAKEAAVTAGGAGA